MNDQQSQAADRARELERLLMRLESAARGRHTFMTFERPEEIASLAGVVRWFVQYLRQAIARSMVPLMVCSSCLRITEDIARSPHVDGARCAKCLGGALDGQIRELRAALDAMQRNQHAIEVAQFEATPPRRLASST